MSSNPFITKRKWYDFGEWAEKWTWFLPTANRRQAKLDKEAQEAKDQKEQIKNAYYELMGMTQNLYKGEDKLPPHLQDSTPGFFKSMFHNMRSWADPEYDMDPLKRAKLNQERDRERNLQTINEQALTYLCNKLLSKNVKIDTSTPFLAVHRIILNINKFDNEEDKNLAGQVAAYFDELEQKINKVKDEIFEQTLDDLTMEKNVIEQFHRVRNTLRNRGLTAQNIRNERELAENIDKLADKAEQQANLLLVDLLSDIRQKYREEGKEREFDKKLQSYTTPEDPSPSSAPTSSAPPTSPFGTTPSPSPFATTFQSPFTTNIGHSKKGRSRDSSDMDSDRERDDGDFSQSATDSDRDSERSSVKMSDTFCLLVDGVKKGEWTYLDMSAPFINSALRNLERRKSPRGNITHSVRLYAKKNKITPEETDELEDNIYLITQNNPQFKRATLPQNVLDSIDPRYIVFAYTYTC